MTAAGLELQPVAEGLFSVDPPALIAGRCRECGWRHFPAQKICPACQKLAADPVALGPSGLIYSYTIVRYAPPHYDGPTPYALGVVELPQDGIRVEATLFADRLEDLYVGAPVSFRLAPIGEGADAVLSFGYRLESL